MADEEDKGASDGAADDDKKTDDDKGGDLGDAGKRALDEERNARKTAEKAARDAKAELDKLRKDSMSDQEKAIADAKAEVRQEVLAQANSRLLRAEVRAAAAGKLADPDDAARLLDLDSFVDDEGDIDSKAIKSAIDKLVAAKPYLSAKPGSGSGEGGARGGSASSEPTMDDLIRQKVAGSRR